MIGEKFIYSKFKREREIGDLIVTLPKPPPKKEIANYDLPKKDQKFSVIQKEITEAIRSIHSWTEEEKVSFENREWDRRENGFWFFNGGYCEYVTGLQYFYLCYWQFPVVKDGMKKLGLPNFYDSDRDKFYHWGYCNEDSKCFGQFEITNRRDGKTYRALCTAYEKISKTPESKGGMQSKNNRDGKDIFDRLILSWQKLPYFFKPIDTGESHPKTSLRFFEPSKRDTKKQIKQYTQVLRSEIDYGTAKDEEYDGEGIFFYLGDEIGKCFGKGTELLMHNGTIKKVENINISDKLMGNDSRPRKVMRLYRGLEQMYKIVPNKGKVWECNENHILSLRISSDKICTKSLKGLKKNDTLNITVKEYLKLSWDKKRHLMLYRTGVNYKENKHIVTPYFLGVWLGDGNQYGCVAITNIDKEVRERMINEAKRHGLNIMHRDYKTVAFTHDIKCKIKATPRNVILSEFKRMNLISKVGYYKGEKRIPEEYLIDCHGNRLQLLAGLIDSDGHLTKKGNRINYEIVQKRKKLAEDIHKLANSLGFYSSINEKRATMKRGDGTIYKCLVYRVFIYGDLYKIPCKISKKKAPHIKKHHKNRRNPLRFGFEVKKTKIDNYYGFSISGTNRLFLLSDYTVVHNTDPSESNVYNRWYIVKECLADGSTITGKALLTTTVEEITRKGLELCKRLWEESDPKKRNAIGQTTSGLYKYFKPAFYGLRGEDEKGNAFIDEFGYSRIEVAKEFLDKKRIGKLGVALASEKHKYPFTEAECFILSNQESPLDTNRIYEQIDYNSTLAESTVVRGNFVWVERDIKAKFVHDPEGRWRIVWVPDEKKVQSNKFSILYGRRVPGNIDKLCSAVDPFDHKEVAGGRKSQASSLVRYKFDPIDPINSKFFAAFYLARPPKPEMFYEDMVIQSFFYGTEILPETNKIGLNNYFRVRGYEKYLMSRPEPTHTEHSKKFQKEPGIPMTGDDARNALIDALVTEVYDNVGYLEEEDRFAKSYFDELLLDLAKFEVNNWTPYDASVAAGLCLLAERKYIVTKREPQKDTQFFREYKNKGERSIRI